MEELHCKGTPAQVARRVLAVLAEDPDLLWLIDQYKDYPRPLPKALNELDGRRVPNELENWPVVTIHLHGKLPFTGDIRAEPTPHYTLLTADARTLKIWHDGQRRRRQITEDFSELAPIWEKVKAELNRRGMVIEAEPAFALPHRKGGRPRYPEDDYAWEQVNVNHRDRKDVYPEWKERADPDRLKQLADPQDSFNKAVRAARGRKGDDSE
jgi:hypothetical protein